MRPEHLNEVIEIENQSFPAPWTKTAFASHLERPEIARYLVATVHKKVVGYVGLFFGGGQGQITNLAVDPKYRQQGIGTRLLLGVIELAQKLKLVNLSLEVRVSNKAAQNLYRKFNFVLVGRRKNYYIETGEDAFVMCIFNINSQPYKALLKKIKQELN